MRPPPRPQLPLPPPRPIARRVHDTSCNRSILPSAVASSTASTIPFDPGAEGSLPPAVCDAASCHVLSSTASTTPFDPGAEGSLPPAVCDAAPCYVLSSTASTIPFDPGAEGSLPPAVCDAAPCHVLSSTASTIQAILHAPANQSVMAMCTHNPAKVRGNRKFLENK